MADIRSYTREKEKREKQNKIKQSKLRLVKSEDEDSFQDKIHRHRLSFFYRILLVVLVCGALVALVTVQYRNKTYTDYEVLSDPGIDIVAGNTSLQLGSNVLIYSKDGATTAGMVSRNTSGRIFPLSNCSVISCFAFSLRAIIAHSLPPL